MQVLFDWERKMEDFPANKGALYRRGPFQSRSFNLNVVFCCFFFEIHSSSRKDREKFHQASGNRGIFMSFSIFGEGYHSLKVSMSVQDTVIIIDNGSGLCKAGNPQNRPKVTQRFSFSLRDWLVKMATEEDETRKTSGYLVGGLEHEFSFSIYWE